MQLRATHATYKRNYYQMTDHTWNPGPGYPTVTSLASVSHLPSEASKLSSPSFQRLKGHQPPACQPHLLCLDQHPIGLHTGASSSDKIKV